MPRGPSWPQVNDLRTAAIALALVLGASGLYAVAPAASAHYCKTTNDSACSPNAHYCPADGREHHHIHDVRWRPDHYCRSGRVTTVSGVDGDTNVGYVEYGIILDEVPCFGTAVPLGGATIPLSFLDVDPSFTIGALDGGFTLCESLVNGGPAEPLGEALP